MTPQETLRIRAELKTLGVPTKSITTLKAIYSNPGMTNTELGAATNMTKPAVSKHVNPLEAKGIIGNSHPHPLWKAWEIKNDKVKNLISLMVEPTK
jgi:DNA-binding MarR family transcriptional regulator